MTGKHNVIIITSSPDSDSSDSPSTIPSNSNFPATPLPQIPCFGASAVSAPRAGAISISSAVPEDVEAKIRLATKRSLNVEESSGELGKQLFGAKRRRLVVPANMSDVESDEDSNESVASDAFGGEKMTSMEWTSTSMEIPSSSEDMRAPRSSRQILPRPRAVCLPRSIPVEAMPNVISEDTVVESPCGWIYPAQYMVPEGGDAAFCNSPTDEASSASEVMTIYRKSPWLRIGCDHPDPLAESQSLSSVRFPVIPDSLELRIPLVVAQSGRLSNPQLETLIQAVNSFSRTTPSGQTQGFFLGEGTGCGKGRIISSAIWHLWNKGYRRHLWLSVSNDLMLDAMRDLRDLGATHIPVIELGSLKLCDLDSPQGESECQQKAAKYGWKWHGEGIVWATYTLLARSMSQFQKKGSTAGDGCASRMDQVIAWMSRAPQNPRSGYDTLKGCKKQDKSLQFSYSFVPEETMEGGLIAMDEAHKAKNLFTQGANATRIGSSAAGLMSSVIQEKLHRCPVLYASATGATELKHMAYLSRLGLWGKNSDFSDFSDFRSKVEYGGVAALECVAMDLKAYGLYSCRTLSFCNIKFNSETVVSSEKFSIMYDKTARLMQRLLSLLNRLLDDPSVSWESSGDSQGQVKPGPQPRKKTAASFLSLAGPELPTLDNLPSFSGPSKTNRGRGAQQTSLRRSQFWATSQRLFKQLLVCQKVTHAVKLALSEVQAGKQVVISLWGTGEARTADKMKELKKQQKIDDDTDEALELDDFLSPPRLMLEKLVDERFPYRNHRGEPIPVYKQELQSIRSDLERCELPCNPLDELIELLGGPTCVAEMSGRMNRLVTVANRVRYVPRTTGIEVCSNGEGSSNCLNSVNVQEQQLFQSGTKKIAVITEAASSGISLHCDRNLPHPSPRVMICIELPWAADKAIQQFGRIHRSNQLFPPAYHLLVTDVGGERRFVAAIARRMKTLGAITRGDRRAAFASRSSQNDTSGDGPLLGFDIYSRWGYQSKSLLFRFLREAPLDAEYISIENFAPPPAVTRGEFSSSTFAAMVVQELQLAGFTAEELTVAGGAKAPLNKSEHLEKGMDKFLNRLMMAGLKIQNQVFEFFLQLHDELVEMAKHNGDLDRGVENLNSSFGQHVSVSVAETQVLWRDAVTQVPTRYFRISVDRGLPWSEVIEMWNTRRCSALTYEGFYLFSTKMFPKLQVAFVLKYNTVTKLKQTVRIFRPATGASQLFGGKIATVENLSRAGWKHVPMDEMGQAQALWNEQFENSLMMCIHQQQLQTCSRVGCKYGRRIHDEHLVTGNILHIWYRLEKWLFSRGTEELEESEDIEGKKQISPASVETTSTGSTRRVSPKKKKVSTNVEQQPQTADTPKRRLRLVKANTSDLTSFVGVRIPEEKVDLIKGNLQASQRNAASRASAVASARSKVFSPRMFREICAKLVDILVANKYDKAVSLEVIYRVLVSENASDDLSDLLRSAFPPDEEGLAGLKAFLSILCECNVGFRHLSQSDESDTFCLLSAFFKTQQYSKGFIEAADRLCRYYCGKYAQEARFFLKSQDQPRIGMMSDYKPILINESRANEDAIALLMRLVSSGLLAKPEEDEEVKPPWIDIVSESD